jgi:D-inositol-3-phosphate glycosyltransferase
MERLPKRVAMICVHTCPFAHPKEESAGGMNVYVRELSLLLGKIDIKVDIYTTAKKDFFITNPGVGVRVIHLDTPPLSNSLNLGEFAYKIISFMLKHNLIYEIFHAHYWLSGMVARHLSHRFNIPFVQNFHSLEELKYKKGSSWFSEEMFNQRRACIEKRLMCVSHHIIAESNEVNIDLQRFYEVSPHKISTVKGGVNLDLFKPIPKQKAKRYLGFYNNRHLLLYVGRLHPIKGLETLITAISLIKEKEKNSSFYLLIIGGIGKRKEFNILKSQVRELKLEDMVIFANAKTHSELPIIYSAADVCIIPSYYESCAITALEAVACHTSLVGTNVGIIPEIIEDKVTGFLVPPGRPDLLAIKLNEILSKQEKDLIQMRKKAADKLYLYTWTNSLKELLTAYNKVISKYFQLDTKSYRLSPFYPQSVQKQLFVPG